MSTYIAYTINLQHGNRIYTDNDTNINEIITLKVKNRQIFCKIIGYTQTMIKVHDVNLEYDSYTNCIKFKIADNYINPVTHGYLDKKRRMYNLDNVIYRIY